MNKLPDFFIVGTVKAGTTSLYNYLVQHPDIYMSPVKEPHYFCTDIKPELFRDQYKKMIDVDVQSVLNDATGRKFISSAFIRNKTDYEKLFSGAKPNQKVGESSTSYMISTVAAANIHAVLPHAKIIIVLRDPVKRAYSHYLMNYRSGTVLGTFNQELKIDISAQPKGWGISRLYVEHGLYYEQVKRYLDLFGEENVKIILNEDLGHHTQEVVKSTFEFLGLNNDSDSNYHIRHNTAVMPSSVFSGFILKQHRLIQMASWIVPKVMRNLIYRKFLISKGIPQIDSESKQLLVGYYQSDILQLQQLIKRDLSHWMN